MIGRGQNCALVSILSVILEEQLDLVCNFIWFEMRPLEKQFLKHGDWTTPVYLSESTKLVQLCIAHPHLIFIQLGGLSLGVRVKWSQLS